MQLSSPDFENGKEIPAVYTCDGRGIAPHLNISEVPEDAKSFVLMMEDPDAVGGTFNHWMVWNIPADQAQISGDMLIPKATEGINSAGKSGYAPPCPPSGIHHYVFDLYALNNFLSLDVKAKREEIESAMQDHIIQKAQLVGLYRRKR
jgi:Raf kinase inhibitor-like YbhB/YbcL family protein